MMLDIAIRYEANYGVPGGIRKLVEDLMRDDPDTFKRGYTRENAIIAAAEAFEVSRAYAEWAVGS